MPYYYCNAISVISDSDKNLVWNELNIQKKMSSMSRKKTTKYGVLFSPSGEERDKKLLRLE